MEAVKLGSATVGLKGRDFAVVVALKRASSELASYQKKIIPIDDHLGISIAGITADARVLSRYMRQECLNYKYSNDTVYPASRLIMNLGNKMQTCTQRYDRRPYGVGLLVAAYDDQGPHIYEVVPSANYFSVKAMSIGSRSQSARTYLEKHLEKFSQCTKEELIKHGLEALKGTLPNEDLLTSSVSHCDQFNDFPSLHNLTATFFLCRISPLEWWEKTKISISLTTKRIKHTWMLLKRENQVVDLMMILVQVERHYHRDRVPLINRSLLSRGTAIPQLPWLWKPIKG